MQSPLNVIDVANNFCSPQAKLRNAIDHGRAVGLNPIALLQRGQMPEFPISAIKSCEKDSILPLEYGSIMPWISRLLILGSFLKENNVDKDFESDKPSYFMYLVNTSETICRSGKVEVARQWNR